MTWKEKLLRKIGSRKMWAGIASFATALITAFNIDVVTTEQIMLIISGIGALMVYIFAEAHVDCKRVEHETICETLSLFDEHESDGNDA